jgi:hypothetical protein
VPGVGRWGCPQRSVDPLPRQPQGRGQAPTVMPGLTSQSRLQFRLTAALQNHCTGWLGSDGDTTRELGHFWMSLEFIFTSPPGRAGKIHLLTCALCLVASDPHIPVTYCGFATVSWQGVLLWWEADRHLARDDHFARETDLLHAVHW